jgi:hypothetical protein
VCTVFIARSFPGRTYASVNGAALGIGSVGLLLTGTPLAWVIEGLGWRAGYGALAACGALAWLAILLRCAMTPRHRAASGLQVFAALRGYGELFRLPHTLGIVGLALFTYASFLSLRGLWLSPLLIDRYGYSLVRERQRGAGVSVLGMVGPPLFGRLGPGRPRGARWIVGYTLACAPSSRHGAAPGPRSKSRWPRRSACVSGFMVMQYADVRAATRRA